MAFFSTRQEVAHNHGLQWTLANDRPIEPSRYVVRESKAKWKK